MREQIEKFRSEFKMLQTEHAIEIERERDHS